MKGSFSVERAAADFLASFRVHPKGLQSVKEDLYRIDPVCWRKNVTKGAGRGRGEGARGEGARDGACSRGPSPRTWSPWRRTPPTR